MQRHERKTPGFSRQVLTLASISFQPQILFNTHTHTHTNLWEDSTYPHGPTCVPHYLNLLIGWTHTSPWDQVISVALLCFLLSNFWGRTYRRIQHYLQSRYKYCPPMNILYVIPTLYMLVNIHVSLVLITPTIPLCNLPLIVWGNNSQDMSARCW